MNSSLFPDAGTQPTSDNIQHIDIEPAGALAWLREVLTPLPLGPFRSWLSAAYALLSSRQSRVRVGDENLRFLLGTEPPKRVTHQADITTRETLLAFAGAIRAGDLVADVGAHVGTFTLVAAARCGAEGRVFAFEPAAASRTILEQNLALNTIGSRVDVVAAAVTDTNGEVPFFADGSDSQNTTLAPLADRFRRSTTRSVTLDRFFHELGRDPDVIKVDVEGAELRVLQGAQRIIQNGATVICDLHPYAWPACGHDWQDLRTWLTRIGRIPTSLDGQEVVEEYQGPVILRRDPR